LRALWAGIALWALRALSAHRTGITLVALWADCAGDTLQALRTGIAYGTSWASGTGRASGATGRTGWTSGAFWTGRASGAGRTTGGAGFTLQTLWADRTNVTLGANGALRAYWASHTL